MKCTHLAVAVALLSIAMGIPIWLQHRAVVRLEEKRCRAQELSKRLVQLRADISNSSLARVDGPPLSRDELSELLHLRAEVGQLHRSLAQARSQAVRIDNARQYSLEQRRREAEHPTARPADIPLEVRQARLADPRAWLEQHPEERTPELRLLPEEKWIQTAGTPRVTDEDFSAWMSLLRGAADRTFARLAQNALAAYGNANDGHFPRELAQLQPYFEESVDAAMLERYTIVPATHLNFLNDQWKGGQWVITEKGPVNPQYDQRMAVGIGTYRFSTKSGRWDLSTNP